MPAQFRFRLVYHSPEMMAEHPNDHNPWHERPGDAARAAAWAIDRAWLLRWVRARMEDRLTPRERHCVELYYFEGLSFAEAGARTGTHASSVCRAVQRAVGRLRAAAAEDPAWRAHYPVRARPADVDGDSDPDPPPVAAYWEKSTSADTGLPDSRTTTRSPFPSVRVL